MLRDLLEDPVPAHTCLLDIACLEGKTQTLRCGVRFMDCQVAPPYASIIPEMMIGIFAVYPQGQLRFAFHLAGTVNELGELRMPDIPNY